MTCRGQRVGFNKDEQVRGNFVLTLHTMLLWSGGLLAWNIKSLTKVYLKIELYGSHQRMCFEIQVCRCNPSSVNL